MHRSMTHSWASTTLGGLAKSLMMSLFPSRARIVDVSCGSCGEGLAMVTEGANGPLLTVWAPEDAGNGSAPLWGMASGPLPRDEPVSVHCLDHGAGEVASHELRAKVDRYRLEGAKQQLPVSTRAGAAPAAAREERRELGA